MKQALAASGGTGTIGGKLRGGITKLKRKANRRAERKKLAALAVKLAEESEAEEEDSESEEEDPEEVASTTTEASPIEDSLIDGGSMMDTGGTNDSPPQSSVASVASAASAASAASTASAASAARPTTPAGPGGTTRQAFDEARSSLRVSVGKRPRSSAPPAFHHAIQPVPSTAEKQKQVQKQMQMQMQMQMQAFEERMKVRTALALCFCQLFSWRCDLTPTPTMLHRTTTVCCVRRFSPSSRPRAKSSIR